MNLKKILILLLILIFKVKNSFAGDPYVGNGNLQLGYDTFQTFKTYVRNNIKKPEIFLVTIDGQNSYYLYCPFGECQSTKKKKRIDECEIYFKKECKIFAMRRTVKWKNGINTGSRKQAYFKYNLSDKDFEDKMIRLGFYGNIKTDVTSNSNIKSVKDNNISKQI
ncbi:hypothetical protein OAP10_04590, partial [Candidatus Pelagibacter sp.]|nr:hypothetical protein [Candidatus Pelagibacter sp.]